MRAQRLSHRCFMGLCCLAAMLAAASVRIESVDARMPALAATMPPSSQDPRRQPLTVRQQAEGPSFFFPQIGDGSEGGIRFRTRLVLVNTGFEKVEVLLEFFDSAGEPLSLQLGEAPEASSLTVALGAGQAFAEETPASGRLKVGYARVSLPAEAEVGGTAVFTRLEQASGIVLYQSGVAAARPLDSFSILLDSRGVRDSGLALVNASSEEDREANLTLRLYDTELNLIASQEVLLAPRSHLARFVNELFPDIEQAGEMLGLVTVESDQPVAALTLLQEDNPLLEFPDEVPTLAGFPVIEGRADQPAAMPEGIPVGPSQVIYFPQIGDGISGDIRFQSNLYLANTGGESLVRLELFDSQGKPLELELSQLGSASQFEFVMARGEVISALSAGLGELAVGYARLEAAQGVGGVSVFSRSDIPSGKLVSQAGVPAVQPLDSFAIFWDTTGVRNTGLALVHPSLGAASPQGQPAEADIGLRLYDKEFRLLDGIGASLAPGQHLPRFVNELFERSLEELQGRQGVLTIDSDAPLAAVTLLQDDDPELEFPDKVPTLTAFPVLPVSSGRQQFGRSDLSISKSVDPSGVVSVGQELTYTLSVFNAGPDEAVSVRVSDELPAGVTFLSVSGPGFSCRQESGTVTCTRPSLAPGAAAQIQIVVAAPSQPGTILNSALIDSLNPIVDPTDNEDEVTSEVVPAAADLSIEKAASKTTVSVGEWLDYSLTVRNAGPDAAHSVEVIDALPPGAALRGFSGTGWSCPTPQAVADGAPLACRLSKLEAEASSQLLLTVSAPGEPGSAVNSASVSSPAQDEHPQDNTDQASTEVNPASADLSIEKDASGEEVSVGDEFDFILTVRNEGPDTAHSVSVRDFLPDTLALKSASPSDWACSPNPPGNPPAGTLECLLASLPASASAELRLRVEPTQEGSLTNAASVSSAASDGNEENNRAERTVVARACDMLINIHAPLAVYLGNDGSAQLEYQIIAANRNRLAPTDASLTARAFLKPSGGGNSMDALELEEGVLPGNSPLCPSSFPVAEFDCPVNLQPSQEIAIALDTEIPRSAIGGQIELRAAVEGPGCPAGLSSAEVIDSGFVFPEPTLAKLGPATAFEGTMLTYRLVIRSFGDAPFDLVVTDQVPDGLAYQGTPSPGWDCQLIQAVDPGVPGCPCVRCQATEREASALDLRFFVPDDYCQRFSGDQECEVRNVAGLSFFGHPFVADAVFTSILSDDGTNGEDCELGLSLRSEPFLIIDNDGSNGELVFEMEITNLSDQTVSGPELKLGLDRMLELREAAAGQPKCAGDNIPANPFECKLSADIAAGEKMTLSFEAEVPPSLFGQTIIAQGSVTAPGTSCAVDGGGGGNQDSTDTEITPDGNVTPRKQGPSLVAVGDSFEYELSIKNGTGLEVKRATLIDQWPRGVLYQGFEGQGWSCTDAAEWQLNQDVDCRFDEVLADNQTSPPLFLRARVPDDFCDGRAEDCEFVNVALVPHNGGADDLTTQVTSPSSGLEVRILVNDTTLDIGNDGSNNQLVYQVEVINQGSAPASAVTVTSDLIGSGGQPLDPSPRLEIQESVFIGQPRKCVGNNAPKVRFECPLVQAVPAQGSVKVSFEAQVPTSLFGGDINVKAEALAPDGTLLTASPQNIDILPDPPLLRVSKSAPTEVSEGETLTYQIILENDQDGVAEQVLVLDEVPGGLLFQAFRGAGWSCSGLQDRPDCSSKCIACIRTQGEGLFGQAPAIELDFLVPVGFCQEVALGEECMAANQAKAIHGLTDEFAFSNPVETTVTRQEEVPGEADLSIAKSDSADPVEAGQGFSYTLAVSNLGPGPAESVTVTDNLPAGLAFVGASGTGWNCSQAGGVLTCTHPSLAIGAAPPITVNVTAPVQPGTLLNSASVSSQTSDPDPEGNSDSESTQVEAAPEQQADLSLAKSDSADPVETGQAFSYTLAVSNAGPDAAESVTVTDTLPAGVGFVGASGAGWDCSQSGGVFTCTRPSLAVGAAPPIIVSVMAPGQPGTLVNSASASSQTDDPEPSGNSDSESTTVIPSNKPPECSAALAEPALLWPPNHQFVSVGVANVSDPDQDAVTLTILGVFQDEPVEGGGDGNTCSDATLNGNGTAQLRAERSQKGDGRVYHLEFEAADGKGGVCRRTIAVCVPSNRGSPSCVDQGPLFDSTRCPDGE